MADVHGPRSAGTGRWVVRIAVIVVIAGLFVYVNFFRDRGDPEDADAPVLPVEVSRASVGTITRSFAISGFAESEQVVTVLPQASGKLTSLTVDVGDWVTSGQVIAQIDTEPYELALSQARTARDAAESALDRARTLNEVGSLSDQGLDQAQAQFDAAQGQLETAELAVRNTTIASPVTGSVVQRHRSVGDMVSPQVPVVTVSNTQELVVGAQIPEQYVAVFVDRRRSIGVRASVPAIGLEQVDARIKFVSPYVQPQTRTFRVACVLTGSALGVVPGMYVELEFILEQRVDVPVLPYDALVTGTTLWYVEGDPPVARSVTVQPEFSNDELFQLREDLADRLFVIDGQHFLSDGMVVRVINTQAPEEDDGGS